MVVAVNKSRKRNSGNKTPEKSHHSLTVIVTVSVILFFFMAFVTWLWLSKTPKQQAPKPQHQEQPRQQRPVNTYSYTEILEHKEIDSGSGVTITRNYEAERQAKEAEYYRKIAEKKKRAAEEKARLQAEKELRQEKERLEKERIRLEKEKARLEKERKAQEAKDAKEARSSAATPGSNPVSGPDNSGIMMVTKAGDKQLVVNDKRQKGMTYLYCQENYRTSRDAESIKARMALEGQASIIYRKKMGGGYVYSLIVGPVNGDKNTVKAAARKVYGITCN